MRSRACTECSHACLSAFSLPVARFPAVSGSRDNLRPVPKVTLRRAGPRA